MSNFEKYLADLARHEEEKSAPLLQDPRSLILVHAGIRLNWLGDFLANPAIEWQEQETPVEQIQFTGTSPDWNEVLIGQCGRSVARFKDLVANNPGLKARFELQASFGDEPILVRASEDQGHWKVLDGMHRFVGAVLEGRKHVNVFVPINEHDHLPVCEAHVVYDLIRGFSRHARDGQGKEDLYHALKLLARTYENVVELLRTRLGEGYIFDQDALEVIRRVIQESE